MIASLVCAMCLAQTPEPDAGWRYVLPAPGSPDEHPPLRALPLGRERPEDVVEKVIYRGKRRRYAQLRYGTPSSVRVTVVLDEFAPGQADLYVDADRNRRIEAHDRAEGTDRTWRVPLKAAVVEGESTTYVPRTMIFRLGATGLTLSSAAAGYLEGNVRLGDRTHRARRTDGDGNGLLIDAQDRIWIDANDDGRWDPAAEQFLFAPILSIGAERFAVRADALGRRLDLEPLAGTGTVRIALARPRGSPPLSDLSVTLLGRDGSVVGLSGVTAEATVPIGEYRVGTVKLTLEDPDGSSPWTFVFAAEGARGEPTWHRVGKGGSLRLDPIGALALTTGVAPESKGLRPGEELRVQPGLYTADGLLIVTCYRGQPTSPAGETGPGAVIALRDAAGTRLGSAHSGFA